jgi:uncharacterized membrane protein
MKKQYLSILWLSCIAWINAIYLSYQAYQAQFISASEKHLSFCDVNETFSCTQVLDHPASMVFGIPFPMIAFVVYPILAWIAIYGLKKSTQALPMKLLALFSAGWILFNSFIIYKEITVIHAYCYLCLICTAIIVTIFSISTVSLLKKK